MAVETLLTYRDYEPDDEGREQLLRMIQFHPHGSGRPRVPPRVRDKVVEQVLNDEVKPDMPPLAGGFAAQVARFYRVRPAAEKFAALLNKHERELAEFVRSLSALRVVGDLGTAEQNAAAGTYYANLLRQELVDQGVSQAIECYFHLDEKVTEKVVSDALNKRIEALQKRGDPRSQEAVADYEDHVNNSLVILKEAKTYKDKLLAERDAAKRAAGLAEAYIGLNDPGGVDWTEYGSYALREELTRSDDKTIVAGLLAAAAKIPKSGDEDSIRRMRAAAARAIAYFGGALTDEQRDWLEHERVRLLPLQA